MPNEKREASYDSSADERHTHSPIKRSKQDESESVSDGTLEAPFLECLHTELTEAGLLQQLRSPNKEHSHFALSLSIRYTVLILMDSDFQHLLNDDQVEWLERAPHKNKDIRAHIEALPEKDLIRLKDIYTGFLETESNFDLGFLLRMPFLGGGRGYSNASIATMESWSGVYTGKAHESLWFHIETLCEKFTHLTYYGKYCSIVQSSGTGKSRLVDEMSKTHFTIPFCLRCDSSEFPPADTNVRNYLKSAREGEEASEDAQAFLTSLFMQTTKWIENNFPSRDVPISEVASTFRDFMNKDQKLKSPSKNRKGFFQSVVDLAKKLRSGENGGSYDGSTGIIMIWKHSTDSKTISNITIVDAAKLLESTLLKFKQDKWKSTSPLVILSFDEAYGLDIVVPGTTLSTPLTHLYYLQRAVQKIKGQAIFSLFLSTKGPIFRPKPPGGTLDSSARVTRYTGLELMQPYTDLGYDMLAQHAVEGQTTIDDVTRIDYLVRLGRPLFATRYMFGANELKKQIITFAAQKLTNMDEFSTINPNHVWYKNAVLACLMCRLGLEFNRRSYESKKQEMYHVENHMRICLQAGPSCDGIHTISPSEPILAEGARLVMKTVPFNAASFLANEYRRPEIERDPRGEAIVKLLVTLATDMVAKAGQPAAWSVPEFLQKLCGPPSSEGVFVCDVLEALPSCVHPESGITPETRLADAFKDSKMNMNHFVKVGDSDVLNRNFMWERIPRCAGVECPPNHPAINLVIPITYYDSALGRYNVTFILFQIHNNIKYGSKPDPCLFDAMDPYELGLFSTDDKDYSVGCIPIIRIVVALASTRSTVVNLSCQASSKRETRQSHYTAYDFWFSGLDHHVWGPIKEEEEESWTSLLDASGRSISEVSETKTDPAAEEL